MTNTTEREQIEMLLAGMLSLQGNVISLQRAVMLLLQDRVDRGDHLKESPQ